MAQGGHRLKERKGKERSFLTMKMKEKEKGMGEREGYATELSCVCVRVKVKGDKQTNREGGHGMERRRERVCVRSTCVFFCFLFCFVWLVGWLVGGRHSGSSQRCLIMRACAHACHTHTHTHTHTHCTSPYPIIFLRPIISSPPSHFSSYFPYIMILTPV